MKREAQQCWLSVILALLAPMSVGEAATTTVMDATRHNGSLTATAVGHWHTTPDATPAGWTEKTGTLYTTAVGWIQAGSVAEAVKNTHVTVQVGSIYKVSADLGGGEGTDATVQVFATQHADGTGARVRLASVHRIGLAGDGDKLFRVDGEPGSPAGTDVAGYYVQVSIGGPYEDRYVGGNYDNIVVTAESDAPEGPLNDIDFWANDRLHLPDYGASGNLIMNPSFEAGFRYWGFPCYAQGVIPLRHSSFHDIESREVHSGSRSLRLRAMPFQNPLPVGVFPLPVNPHAKYTLSFYAKGSLPESLKINVWARGRTMHFLPGVVSLPVNDQWQRFTLPGIPTEKFVSIYFEARRYGSSEEGCIWLDDVQLETGPEATDFKQPPVTAQLVSAARGNFLEFGQAPDFNLVIQSSANANGTVSLSVEDFFFKRVFSGSYPFAADNTGRCSIRLDELNDAIRANNLRGVFIVTAVFSVDGASRPYTDYFRFSVMDFLKNAHKNKDMFNLTFVYQLQSGGPEFERFLERGRAIGFGSFTYDFGKFANDLDYDLDSERMKLTEAYGFACMGRPVLKLHDGDNGEISELNGTLKMTGVKHRVDPDAFALQSFAAICTEKARNRPWNNIWWFTGESNPGCQPLENHPDAFARFLIATNRGIKAGNPRAKVLIEGGPWNLAPNQGTQWVERYIRDAKRIDANVQFDGAAAHHYRDFPETPDLDGDIAAFIAMLDRNGCGDWLLYINEGGNYCPFDIPEEKVSPYEVHSANWWYMGPLSYHCGRSERISAAFSARNWIIGLKYHARVKCMNDFMTPSRFVDADFTPRFYEKIPNTLGQVLGNASFVKDIVFAPDCRGYLFRDDASGVPIAVIWGHKESVDKWQQEPPSYAFDFDDQDVEFVDLMENNITFPKDGSGRTVIPLTPFPIFIKGLPGTEDRLHAVITHYAQANETGTATGDSL